MQLISKSGRLHRLKQQLSKDNNSFGPRGRAMKKCLILLIIYLVTPTLSFAEITSDDSSIVDVPASTTVQTEDKDELLEADDELSDNEQNGYQPQPLRHDDATDFMLFGGIFTVASRYWRPAFHAYGIYALDRAVRATVAISIVTFDRKLNWKEKAYGIGYYSTYYAHVAAYLVGNRYINPRTDYQQNQQRDNHRQRYNYQQRDEARYDPPPETLTRNEIFEEMRTHARPGLNVTNDDAGFRRLYRSASRLHHPDRGGDEQTMGTVNDLNDRYNALNDLNNRNNAF